MEHDPIPGTRVPDTPIHRASMWLERFRFGDRRKNAGVEDMEDDYWSKFIDQTGLEGLDADDIEEAARYYGHNNVRMLVGNRLNVRIASPTGEGFMDLGSLFVSLWADAFAHGVVTAKGLSGLSNQEEEQHGD